MKLKYYGWLLTLAATAAFVFGSCSVSARLDVSPNHSGHRKSMPPGQAKKAAGSQSAAPFAPGHNK